MNKNHYLLTEMPRKVLFGSPRDIHDWCFQNGKAIPNLLDLGEARSHVRKNRKARK